ncbi:Na/Pi cotransporter family protein [Mariprofundus sp. EBB-1]|uniref:Na/Pi cotransporter family protein n=1 Tax=Mariprofundus sp. EBB-1 TaxID=2650971 RepID=UPI000EF21256|nr:Na/Pi symporter [Mariprofundus sp. EBB-1]RLL52281.1 Na/Pi cotransporter family protein [Mariprofundus sp. EBB-1]
MEKSDPEINDVLKSVLGKILLPTIFIVLAYGFWISPNFKEIAAGIAIFLFGMLALEEGFRAFTGGVLEQLLKRSTNKLWKSLSFGVLTTTIMQSSSLVSVIAISFLGAGLIGLAQGIGIVFGANLGTTTGAWLVAGFGLKVKISAYAMPMLVFGVILLFQKSRQLKGIGYVLMGLGFLFLGIHYMKEGFEAFKDTIHLTEYAVAGYRGLLLFTLIGVAATVIMQSSHATLVLIITALAAQQITYENALALAIGANIGTTITAILGSLSSNEQGKRLAGAHLIFNTVTGLIAIILMQPLMQAVEVISGYAGIAANDYTLKLALFHTLFNLIGIIVMVPFINRLVGFLERIIRAEPDHFAKPKHLNDSALEFSDTAVEAIRLETLHIYGKATEIIARGLSLTKKDIFSDEKLKSVINRLDTPDDYDVDDAYDHYIKSLYRALLHFINRMPNDTNTSPQTDNIRFCNQAIILMLKDVKHLQKNMLGFMASINPDIRKEYNHIRRRIAKVLRRLEKIRDQEQSALTHDALDRMLEKNDELLHRRLDGMIRRGQITADMAISLMNDSSYAYNIIRNLIEINRRLILTDKGNEDMMLSENSSASNHDLLLTAKT